MGTKSRETIYGASVRAAAERAAEARKDADRLAREAWNKRMLGFQGPAQPSPALGDAINAGYRYLEVRCLGCDTHQTVALAIGCDRQKRRSIQPRSCARKHRWRDIRANNHAPYPDKGKRHIRGLACSSAHIKDAATRFDRGSRKHGRNKKPQPSASPAGVCQSIHRLARLDVETGPEPGASSLQNHLHHKSLGEPRALRARKKPRAIRDFPQFGENSKTARNNQRWQIARTFSLVVFDARGTVSVTRYGHAGVDQIICSGPAKANRLKMIPPLTVTCIGSDGCGKAAKIEVVAARSPTLQ